MNGCFFLNTVQFIADLINTESQKKLMKCKSAKQCQMVMINFIDIRKAFDCLHRPSMWSILRQYGIPDTIVTIIQNLYKGSRSCVKLNGVCGDWFEVVTGVRQGCILSPLLFAIVIDWVIQKSLTNSSPRTTGMGAWQQAVRPRLRR